MPIVATSQLAPPKSWDEFEDLCADLFMMEWADLMLVRHGRQGQRQNGVDSYGRLKNGTFAGIQCKGKRQWPPNRITKNEMEREVAKATRFRPKLSEFVFATTQPDDQKLQRHARFLSERQKKLHLFSVHILGWDELVRRLTKWPDLVEKHYAYAGFSSVRDEIRLGIQEIQLSQRDVAAVIRQINEHFSQRRSIAQSDLKQTSELGSEPRNIQPNASRSHHQRVTKGPLENQHIRHVSEILKTDIGNLRRFVAKPDLALRAVEEDPFVDSHASAPGIALPIARDVCFSLVKDVCDEFCLTAKLVIHLSHSKIDEAYSIAEAGLQLRQSSPLKALAHLGYWLSRMQPARIASLLTTQSLVASFVKYYNAAIVGPAAEVESEEGIEPTPNSKGTDYNAHFRKFVRYPLNEYIALNVVYTAVAVIWDRYARALSSEDERTTFGLKVKSIGERFWARSQEMAWSLKYENHTPDSFSSMIETMLRTYSGDSFWE